jgi:outer membrane protein assembly factor BamB
VIAAAVLLALRLLAPLFPPDGDTTGVLGGFGMALAILVWWVFFSRAAWLERIGALVVMTASLIIAWPIVDKSVATGMMGAMLPAFAIPIMSVALVGWAVATRRLSKPIRYTSLVVACLLASASFALVRTAGMGAGRLAEFHWRWTPTPEERLIADEADRPTLIPSSSAAPHASESPSLERALDAVTAAAAPKTSSTPGADEGAGVTVPEARTRTVEWPGFRGLERDGVVRGLRIETDWVRSPPAAMWRRPIGPGWSSFAVDGDLLYTQEQRGDEELVTAYRVSTGEPVWRHRDPVRFWESNGGAGPRGTPTIANGRLYAFGATGILNALDATRGARIWSRNVAVESSTEVPMWGFSSSPLLIDDTVVVAASGRLAAYDARAGAPRWLGPEGGFSYSSPHRLAIGGVTQVMLLGGNGAVSLSPADGAVLWKHEWSGGAIVQPAVLGDGQLLINSLAPTGGLGIRRLAVAKSPGGAWTVDERWTSNGLKPYYDDFVIHNGHAFGADGSILACIDLTDGARKWKGGRYGPAQVLLLPDQDLLLVLTEEGDVALVSATPDRFTEIARMHAIDGKTWNHPVIVRDVLLIRSGEEMAAFRLPRAR